MTTEIVLEVFDSFEDKFVQSGALRARLEQESYDAAEVVSAVDKSIGEGKLAWSEMRSLYRP